MIFIQKDLMENRKLIFGIYKINSKGFTLIEMLVVIALIGILSAIIAPIVIKKTERQKRELFVARLNELVSLGWQHALRTHAVHQITVDPQGGVVTLHQVKEKEEMSQLQDVTQSTTLEWPYFYEIKQVFIEGFHEKNSTKFWFFITPEGLAQTIIINFFDTYDVQNDYSQACSLVLNPFYAQFKIYDTFQNPS